MDAPDGRRAGDRADQAGDAGHSGRAAAAAAARAAGRDPGQPHRRPRSSRCRARWPDRGRNTAVPLFLSAKHGHIPPVDEVRTLVAYIACRRDDSVERPFEIVLGGATPPDDAEARAVLGPLVEAGATWWDERQVQDDRITELDPVLRRIDAGPPTL